MLDFNFYNPIQFFLRQDRLEELDMFILQDTKQQEVLSNAN